MHAVLKETPSTGLPANSGLQPTASGAFLTPPRLKPKREAVLAGDRKALDAWWDSLEIEGTSFWSRLKNRF